MHRKRPDLRRPNRRIEVSEMVQAREQTMAILDKLTPKVLTEAERRSRETCLPDGYPSGTGDGGSRSSDPTSSTERAALRLIAGEYPTDETLTACQHLRNALEGCWDAAITAEDAWTYVLHVSQTMRERASQSTLGTCQACFRDDVPNVGSDRIVAGYCPACFKAWQRTAEGTGSRQDRMTFEASRRELKSVEAS